MTGCRYSDHLAVLHRLGHEGETGTMHRRRILRRLGLGGVVGLGGCVRPPSSDSQSRAAPPTDPPPPRLQRRVSLDDRIAVPDRSGLRIEPRVVEPAITDSHTARIRVTVTNTGPARGIPASTGGCALFNRYSQVSDPRGLWLGREPGDPYVTQSGPRWIADPPENGAYPDYGCDRRTYEPGESVSVEYALFHDERTRGYLDPGTYWFVVEDVLIAPVAGSDEGDPSTLNWGFSIRLTDPD